MRKQKKCWCLWVKIEALFHYVHYDLLSLEMTKSKMQSNWANSPSGLIVIIHPYGHLIHWASCKGKKWRNGMMVSDMFIVDWIYFLDVS